MSATSTIDLIIAVATAATAVGTLGLAVATYTLARQTRDVARSGQATAESARREVEIIREQAEASQAQLEISREMADATARQTETSQAALQASIRPLIVEVPWHTYKEVHAPRMMLTRDRQGPAPAMLDLSEIHVDDDAEEARVELHVRNVGAGVAIVIESKLWFGRPEAPVHAVMALGRFRTVAPGEYLPIEFSASKESSDWLTMTSMLGRGDGFMVAVRYTDLAGEQASVTRLHVKHHDNVAARRWRILAADVALREDTPLGTPWS